MKLKNIRLKNKLSQSQLSRKADISVQSIQAYEQKKQDINKAQAIQLYKISKALNCTIEDLLELD